MANTSRIKILVEPEVRAWLGERFQATFSEETMPIITGSSHDVDAVSADGSIIADILSNRAKTRTGRSNTGGLRKAETDFWRLSAVTTSNVVTRLMVFTNADFMKVVRKRIGDPSTMKVEFLHCPLKRGTQHELDRVLDDASREQRASGDK
ncbi:MAG: hypothetical protein J4N63_11795 [Chloroflexi bacterium]|nr:hypothetical protein [Chloroflexota bacterium]